MKQILKVLGTSFVMVVVVLGLLIILNNISFVSNGKTYTGIFELLGKGSTIENISYSKSDSVVFESIAVSKAPIICFGKAELENIIKDKDIDILRYFKVKYNREDDAIIAKNIDENHLKILDITDESGDSFMNLYNKKLKTIKFNHPDIYTITFYLLDNEQKETTARIKIPVN